MDYSSMLKKNKINTIYKYSEFASKGGVKQFGWKVLDNLEEGEEFVMSYPSSSKKTSTLDKEWSKEEGRSIAMLNDYRLFFDSFVGLSPEAFIDKYAMASEEVLRSDWIKINKAAVREDEGAFYLNLAKLIATGKRFSMYGRIFKLYSEKT